MSMPRNEAPSFLETGKPEKMSAWCKARAIISALSCVVFMIVFFIATAYCVAGRSGDISWLFAAPNLLLAFYCACHMFDAVYREKEERTQKLQKELYEDRIRRLEAELSAARSGPSRLPGA